MGRSMKVVIADDEPLARTRLRNLLSDMAGIEVVAEAGDGDQALQACAAHTPDLVLLDIAMPGMDGLEAARHMAALQPRPAVVFCTAYDAHALSAFEAEAIDYLVKPVRAERLTAALERVRTFLAGLARADDPALPVATETDDDIVPRAHLCARLRGGLRLIPLDDVRYLLADEKYVVVHHANGEDLIEESLRSLEEEFGPRFVRIHRNCLVARDRIVEQRRSPEGQVTVILREVEQPLEVSRRCVAGVRETLLQL